MPEEKVMREKICIRLMAAVITNTAMQSIAEGIVRTEEKDWELLAWIRKNCHCITHECAHWIWDEGVTKRDGMRNHVLGPARKGHCGLTQHKPFVINAEIKALPKEGGE